MADIHLLVERRVGGRWELVTPRFLDVERRMRGILPEDMGVASAAIRTIVILETKPWAEVETDEDLDRELDLALEIVKPEVEDFNRERLSQCFYEERDYETFACLCTISAPRGLPEDISDEARGGDIGDHTYSWLTLKELLDYDWKANYRREDCVPFFVTRVIPQLKEIGPPDDVRIVFGFDS